MNILIIFGTRPEAIKLAPVIKMLATHFSSEKVKVCVTGQHREMLDPILDFFSIKPEFDLNIMRKNQTLGDITGQILKKLSSVFHHFRPDIIFVHGDTTTTLAASLRAFYEKIMVAHVEAGLRSGNIYSPWPEELNRQVTGLIAHYHFAPTHLAADNLIKAGVAKSKIVVTGNTVIDALIQVRDRLTYDSELEFKIKIQFSFLNFQKKIILVTGHRRENFGKGFENICQALVEIADDPNIQIIYPVHLNPNVRKPVFKLLGHYDNIFLIDPLDYISFVYLMCKCHFILTDSGGIQEEAPSLGKPVLVMREVTERMESIIAGTAKLVGIDKNKIVTECSRLLNDDHHYKQMSSIHNLFGDGRASERILKKLLEEPLIQRDFTVPQPLTV
jgi:UDP-N-acetylglucosamine 2-epimerase (non-hydrolysing)